MPIPAIDRIRIFSASQWEDFVLEWVDSLREVYDRVERCAGAGDMGRDVIGFVREGNGAWDNFQCKHHVDPLTPGDIWTELGKLIYYVRRGDYTYPRRYNFIAPRGAGTTLSNLFKKPTALRRGLLDNWGKHCQNRITKREEVKLDAGLEAFIQGLDFSIFDATPPLRIIDAHARTRWHIARFGGGLPTRPPVPPPPPEMAPHEAEFARALFDAYADHLQKPVRDVTDLALDDDLRDHFGEARVEFYSAESLRLFSRDTLPPGVFQGLQDEVHGGIKDELRAAYPDGYRRVMAVVRTARTLPLDGHVLRPRMNVGDHGGICHQLANERLIKWVK